MLANEIRDIVIAGGGLTGASLACALADGKRRIRVLEARAGRSTRFAGELIHPTGVDVLDRLGLLEPLRRAGGVDVAGFVVCGAPGRDPVRLPYAEIEGRRPAGFAIEHHDMVAALRTCAAARSGVSVELGARVNDFVREGERIVGVSTDRGGTFRADLTLVAEGRHSRLRGRLGIEESSRLVSYTAAVLVEDTDLPIPGYGHIFLGAPGPILAYPIARTGERWRVRMCFDLPALPDERGADRIGAYVRERYAEHVPEPLRSGLIAALAAAPPDFVANHSIATRRCQAPGAALLGESGGCSHPITASGMTVCLTDVRALVEELAAGGFDTDVLARYQARRYRFVRAREVLADAIYEVFRADTDGTRAMREGILRYWESGPRARSTSLALLSGADSRLGTFLGEYWRVASHGLDRSLRGAVPGNGVDVNGRWRSLRGLVGKSVEKLSLVATHVREGTLR